MRWRFWRRDSTARFNGGINGEAVKAKLEAQRKLREARRDWPKVKEAHDQLAEWIETALRGHGV